MSARPTPAHFRFADFLLQPGERRLLARGEPVPLEPRALDVLTALVERAGQLVTKDELLERVWRGRVVEDSNLHVQVSALRKALGQHAIATIGGQGYRFVIQVDRIDAQLPASFPYQMPRPVASFIGREDDLAMLIRALAHTRLITLTGIGGCGKTRLAIEFGERVTPSFTHGACFVDLAAVADSERIGMAIAAALRVREEPDKPIEQTLVQHLSDQHLLLVLDNCEHVIEACARMVERILLAGTRLTVLVTSREALAISGERRIRVRSLQVPPPEAASDLSVLGEYESVRLFIDRAGLMMSEFVLDAGNASAVGEICRRLDGIPLAIELAAARTRLLSPENIRARLDDRFRLLTGGTRTVPRHQTLLAALQSSYDHLQPAEQRWLRALSIFASGWSLEAARAVAGPADEVEAMERLGRLADKSLILVDGNSVTTPRFRMLETVRQFAGDRLADAGDGAVVRQRHLAYFLTFARTAQANLFGDDMRPWLDRIDVELPNLLAAHAWCDHDQDGANHGLDLAANLRGYWLARGLFEAGQRVYDDALARPGFDVRGLQLGKVLHAFGQHNYVRGRLREAIGPTTQALSIAREHGDHELTVYCLDRLSLAFAWLGEVARARACSEDELAVATRTGDRRLLSFALTAKGAVCRVLGDLPAAGACYEQALTLLDGRADLNNRYNTLINIARVAIALDSLDRARETLVGAIRLVAEMGTIYRGHFALEATARLAAARADWAWAARFQGASDTTVDQMGGVRNNFDDAALASLHERSRAMLGTDSYDAAYADGHRLPIEQALDEALAWLDGTDVVRVIRTR